MCNFENENFTLFIIRYNCVDGKSFSTFISLYNGNF
jgi:hypothetical protein